MGSRKSFRIRGIAAIAVAAALAAVPATAGAADFAGTARNIIPSGQYGAVPRRPGPIRRRRCTTA